MSINDEWLELSTSDKLKGLQEDFDLCGAYGFTPAAHPNFMLVAKLQFKRWSELLEIVIKEIEYPQLRPCCAELRKARRCPKCQKLPNRLFNG